jgi:membrane-associated phospholipid phosphatase
MSSRNAAQTPMLGSNWALPLFITKENRYFAGFLMFLIAAVLYLTANHIHLFPPQLLPLSWVDQAIPFLPNTVWFYLSEYIFFGCVYALTRDYVNLNKYWYSFVALQLVSVAIFWIWPTTYPRDGFPLTTDLNSWTYYAFSSLRETDTPANCCPSLHVSSVYLSTFIFLDEQKKKFPFFFVWGTLIALSTLTTKQHYLIDVVTGFIMAVIFYWTFHRWIPYGKPGAQAKR